MTKPTGSSCFHLCSPWSSGSMAFFSLDGHTGLFLPHPPLLSIGTDHPVITVPVNRSVFTTARTDFRVKSACEQVDHRCRLGMMAAFTWRLTWFSISLQLITLTFTDPERVFSSKGRGYWPLQFHIKTAVCLLVLWQAWPEPADPFSTNSWTLVGARPLGLLWFCDVYSTSHWFLWLLLCFISSFSRTLLTIEFFLFSVCITPHGFPCEAGLRGASIFTCKHWLQYYVGIKGSQHWKQSVIIWITNGISPSCPQRKLGLELQSHYILNRT